MEYFGGKDRFRGAFGATADEDKRGFLGFVELGCGPEPVGMGAELGGLAGALGCQPAAQYDYRIGSGLLDNGLGRKLGFQSSRQVLRALS